MRYEIVYTEGGYYFDANMFLLKDITKLFQRKEKFVGCNEIPRFKNVNILSNSFFGATQKTPILKRLLLKSNLDSIDFYDSAVDFQTGPGYLRSGILPNDNYFIFQQHIFILLLKNILLDKILLIVKQVKINVIV